MKLAKAVLLMGLCCACNSTSLAWQSYMVVDPVAPQQAVDTVSAVANPRSSVLANRLMHRPDPVQDSQVQTELFPPQTYPNEKLPGAATGDAEFDWLGDLKVGYDRGFLIGNRAEFDLGADALPFLMRVNGWGQLRHTIQESTGSADARNQFQLKRARLIFSGSAFTEDFAYYFQFDGRSSSGDTFRVLDYMLTYDFGHHRFGLEPGKLGFKTGKYKIPFNLSRYLSGREFEFSDRSMASMFFDVNRSLAWGLYGYAERWRVPVNWEVAIFNGLVTGGAETGSSGDLDNNFAYSARVFSYPIGNWGSRELADLSWHRCLAMRVGAGYANSTVDYPSSEFDRIRVVDSGRTLADVLSPLPVNQYTVNLYSLDASLKYRGWSFTSEFYFRRIDDIRGAVVPDLFDHGYWFQLGKFVVPGRTQILARWSRVVGESELLGTGGNLSSDERSAAVVWYLNEQHAKLTIDATYLNGAPIDSSALDIAPGDNGWLLRTQIQFAF